MADEAHTHPSTDLVTLRDVSATYPGAVTPALNGMDIAVTEGEFLAILGPSGSGKTTALRVIAGFERIQTGEIHIDGKLVAAPNRHVDPERRRVGMVFQDYALFPHLTVADNVAFGLPNSNGSSDARVGAVLDLVDLAGYENRYPHELSGGQQQRIALARSLAPEPVALLLDEPFSNLDRQLRSSLRRQVREIVKDHGTTSILVTHDREEALGIADRVAVMVDGRVIQVGEPENLYRNSATADVARMVGPSDTVRGRIAGPWVDTEAGRFRYHSPTGPLGNGTFVEAVLRAHDLELGPWEAEGAQRIVDYREYQGEFTEYGVRLPSGRRINVRRRSIAPLDMGTKVIITAPFDRPVLVYPETPRG